MKLKFDEFDARYINPLTDFGFHVVFGDKANKDLLIDFLNQVIKEEGIITDVEYLTSEQWGNFKADRKVRERTKTIYSNKLEFAFVELPKFSKTEKELETNFDKWLFILKNLSKLKERPASIKGKIFDKLFKLTEIKRLTKKEMETYKKSITDYYDVRLCMDYAREEALERGIEKGKTLVIQKCLQKNMPIEDIIYITGFSKEQINCFMDDPKQD